MLADTRRFFNATVVRAGIRHRANGPVCRLRQSARQPVKTTAPPPPKQGGISPGERRGGAMVLRRHKRAPWPLPDSPIIYHINQLFIYYTPAGRETGAREFTNNLPNI